MNASTQTRLRWFAPHARSLHLALAGRRVPAVAFGTLRLAWMAQRLRSADGGGKPRLCDARDAVVVRRCRGLSTAIPVQHRVVADLGRGGGRAVQLDDGDDVRTAHKRAKPRILTFSVADLAAVAQ